MKGSESGDGEPLFLSIAIYSSFNFISFVRERERE